MKAGGACRCIRSVTNFYVLAISNHLAMISIANYVDVIVLPLLSEYMILISSIDCVCRYSESIDDLRAIYEKKERRILRKRQNYEAFHEKINVRAILFC